MGKKILDASIDRVEGCEFEWLVGVVESLGGFADWACFVDAMETEGLIGVEFTLVLVVFMGKYNF